MAKQEPSQVISNDTPQFQLCVRTFAPFKEFSGFEGDNRSFSTSDQATYRTGGFLVFDLKEGMIADGPTGNSSGTRKDETDAPIFADVTARVDGLEGDPNRVVFTFATSGANPAVPGSPNIDVVLSFVAFLRDGNLFVAGELVGDGFPNAEVFLRDHRRNPFTLLTFQTPHGPNAGPVTLIGDGTEKMGRFKFGIMLDESNAFIGSVPFDQ